jgi:uncharacterized membrane protein YheB (UPF0754 family)
MAATRHSESTSRREKKLMEEIEQKLAPDLQSRFEELIVKREDEVITAKELKELIGLTNQVERMDVRRLECLTELARLRKTTVPALMEDLGIRVPRHG